MTNIMLRLLRKQIIFRVYYWEYTDAQTDILFVDIIPRKQNLRSIILHFI